MITLIQGIPFEFYGEVYTAYLGDDRQFYVLLSDVCHSLGLDSRSQRRRIQNDEAISDRLVGIQMDTPYKDTFRKRNVSCLNLRALPYWLGTIDVKRVNSEHQRKVILYKREFAEAAWAVFRSDMMSGDMLAEMDTYATPQEREYHEIMDQARRLKKQIDLLSGRVEAELERVGGNVDDLAGRLGVLEEKLIGRTIINPAQAQLLNDQIAAVALALRARYPKRSKSQCFADVHTNFKRTFQVHIYSILPEDRLDDAISYLAGQWQRLNPDKVLPEIFRGGNQPSLF